MPVAQLEPRAKPSNWCDTLSVSLFCSDGFWLDLLFSCLGGVSFLLTLVDGWRDFVVLFICLEGHHFSKWRGFVLLAEVAPAVARNHRSSSQELTQSPQHHLPVANLTLVANF